MIALNDITDLYPVPDPLTSEAAYGRFNHFDVPGLTSEDLQRELVVLRLVNFSSADEWRLEREAVVAAELERRRV